MRTNTAHRRARRAPGVTLVELLVALAIVAIMTSFLFTTFATTTRTIELGEARHDIVQNTRVALDLMAREIQSAVIDARQRNFVFVCADGLNSLPYARIEYPTTGTPPVTATFGVGNAQYPLGLDFAANGVIYGTYGQIYDLYRAPFGAVVNSIVSIKPNDVQLPLGPPDRLDFVGLSTNQGGFSFNSNAQFAEIRYMIATDTFSDGADNDGDGSTDAADATLPGGTATWASAGDVLALNNVRAENLGNVVTLSLYRAIDTTPDSNPFSVSTLGADPVGRYPFRDFTELTVANQGERIGAFIYDLQFEFYGRIATLTDAAGIPTRFGVGWGLQDVRGEDIGADGDPTVVDTDGSQGNGVLNPGEDLGTDGRPADPTDRGATFTLPDNLSNNNNNVADPSVGEANGRLDSRVMGVWDSRAPDPRNPRSAAELNGVDDDGDAATLQADGIDNDLDGAADDGNVVDDRDVPEAAGATLFDSVNDDTDGTIDDRFYEAAGRPEGVDEADEGTTADDALPRAVRITIIARDRRNVLDPVVMSTTVWLPAAE